PLSAEAVKAAQSTSNDHNRPIPCRFRRVSEGIPVVVSEPSAFVSRTGSIRLVACQIPRSACSAVTEVDFKLLELIKGTDHVRFRPRAGLHCTHGKGHTYRSDLHDSRRPDAGTLGASPLPKSRY